MSRQAKLRLLKIAITIVILTVLASTLDLGYSWTLLKGIDVLPAVMAIGLLAASHMVASLIWRRLLNQVGIPIGIERTVSLYYAGLFLNNFLLGNVGGDTYKVYAVYRESGAGRAALAATLMERLIGFSALMLLGTAAVVVRFNVLPDPFRWLLLLATGGGTAVGLGILVVPEVVRRITRPLILRAPGLFRDRFNGVVEAMRTASRPAPVAAMLLVALAAQGVRVWTHWWCARALGIMIDPGDLFMVIPLVAVVSAMPISIGGLGVREGSGVLLLAPLGIAGDQVFTMELLAYLVGVATSLLGGLTFLFGREVSPSEVESIESAV